MAPPNQPEDSSLQQNPVAGNDDAGTNSRHRDNIFVNFRHRADGIAASLFADLAEVFPGLQKYVPSPNKGATDLFDSWAGEALRRFNDSYERATNPERKRIERMSCYDDSRKGQQQEDHIEDLGRRWMDRRRPPPMSEERTESVDAAPPNSRALPRDFTSPNMDAFLESFGLFPNPFHDRWHPSIDYLQSSQHSPLQLEQDSLLSKNGLLWRAAFEDLLHAQHGLPMNSSENNSQQAGQTQGSWLDKLAHKGFITDRGVHSFLLGHTGIHPFNSMPRGAEPQTSENPKLRENFYAAQKVFSDLPSHPTPTQVADAFLEASKIIGSPKEDTELDYYEAFHQPPTQSDPAMPSWARCPGLFAPTEDEDDDSGEERDDDPDEDDADDYGSSSYTRSTSATSETGKPGQGILESLTTTERRVLPDGSVLVHTKLKKKFTDGTEWNDEATTLTKPGDAAHEDRRAVESHQSRQRHEPPTRQSKIMDAVKEQQKKTEKSKGWFWSGN